jgi:hypothetical protein
MGSLENKSNDSKLEGCGLDKSVAVDDLALVVEALDFAMDAWLWWKKLWFCELFS